MHLVVQNNLFVHNKYMFHSCLQVQKVWTSGGNADKVKIVLQPRLCTLRSYSSDIAGLMKPKRGGGDAVSPFFCHSGRVRREHQKVSGFRDYLRSACYGCIRCHPGSRSCNRKLSNQENRSTRNFGSCGSMYRSSSFCNNFCLVFEC